MWNHCLIMGKSIIARLFHFLDIKNLQAMPIYSLNSWIFKIQEKKISTPLHYSAKATITEYHRWLEQQNFYFLCSVNWKSKIKVAIRLLPGMASPCVVNSCFLLCTHIAFLQRWRLVVVEERPFMSFSPLIRTQVQSDEGPNLVTSFSSYCFHIGPISKYCHNGP